jgi:Fe-S-cluster containining protein
MAGYADEAAAAAAGLFADIDAATEGFSERSGLRCAAGCGACCLKPGIEARVSEMLPAAAQLVAEGRDEAVLERALAAREGRCVFYEADAAGERRGRCGAYAVRPSICRLFGFAAAARKDGARELVGCRILKDQVKDEAGGAPLDLTSAPSLREFGLRADMLVPQRSWSELYPINEALALAIDRARLSRWSVEAERS